MIIMQLVSETIRNIVVDWRMVLLY